MNKKWLTLGSLTALATPLTMVASCGLLLIGEEPILETKYDKNGKGLLRYIQDNLKLRDVEDMLEVKMARLKENVSIWNNNNKDYLAIKSKLIR